MPRWWLAAVVVLAAAAGASAKQPLNLTLPLVRAQCEGTPPGPCSRAFAFTTGVAVLRGNIKEPAPTCPKTNNPTETKVGLVKMAGVAKSGAPFTGQLMVEVDLKTTFGADPDGNCSLAASQLLVASLTGTLDCKGGRCKGALFAIACLPKPCADTPVTTELNLLVVKDDAGAPLATPGINLVPAKSDAP